ncbi:hypothetical protein Ancab_008474 [Ancistrocladus abbreviatus]
MKFFHFNLSNFNFHLASDFKYEKNTDSILIVTEKNYKNCNITAPLQALTNGDSEFKFGRSGPFFFISGNADHCYKGQKLIVVVLAIRKHRAPPAAPIPFPTPATPTPSPESKPPTPVSKAPKPSSSAPEPPTNEPSMNPSNVDAPATAPHASYAAKFGCSVGLVLGVIIGTTMFLSSFVELM